MRVVPKKDFKNVPFKLYLIRSRYGLSQKGMGNLLLLTQAHMSNMERGLRSITYETALRIEDIFSIPMDVFLTGGMTEFKKHLKRDRSLPRGMQ